MRPKGGERGVPGVPGAERDIPGGGETVLPRVSSRRGLLADGWPEETPRSSNKGAGVSGPRASGVACERWMSGVEGRSGGQGEAICAGRGAVGDSPRSRLRPPGGCRSRPRPREASRAVPRSNARWISLGVPELLPRSVGPDRRGSSGSGLGLGGLPLSAGGVEGDPNGDESSESRYHVASSMRDLLLPFWASPGLGELGPQAQQARLSPLLESSRRLGDWRPQVWPDSAGSNWIARNRGKVGESPAPTSNTFLLRSSPGEACTVMRCLKSRGMLMRSPPSLARSLLRLKVPRRRRTCGRSRSTCCSSSVSSRSNTSSSHCASRCSRRRSCSAWDRCSRAARVSSSSRLSSSFSLARSSSKRPWISRFQPSCMEWKESRGISLST